MRAGRNEPCPCGSGKKFKHCHGGRAREPVAPDDAAWRRVRLAVEGYPPMLLRFIRGVYGPDAIDEAWDDFMLWPTERVRFEPDTPQIELFMPWFFHSWAPDPAGTAVEDESLHDRSPTSVLLERRGTRLEPVLRRYLEACVDARFSFHEVLRSDPGRGLRTRDFFTGAEHDVLERSASESLQGGDTLFGQLVSTEGITLIEAVGPFAVPPGKKLDLIDLRERISCGRRLAPDDLENWAIEIREAYLDHADRLMNPIPPHLHNTDGEEIVLHHLVFGIDSPRAALSALADLTLDETEEELLEEADLDSDGELRRVTFAWKVAGNAIHKRWDSTVHGHIEIEGRELRADVNSAERAARLRGILEQRLGQAIRHERTRVESVEEAMSSTPPDEEGTPREPSPAAHTPEVRAALREVMEAHYEDWVSEPVPALGGLTPIEAARDRVGREKVDALVTEMERSGLRMDPQTDPAVFVRMRERLGLVRPDF